MEKKSQNNYADFFHGKKITMMGLGILGRGVNVAKFLARNSLAQKVDKSYFVCIIKHG